MANRFAVATGDYSSSTVWSTTDGGASGAAAPTNVDAVFLTATSGNITVTLSANGVAASLDCTGFTGTLALNASLSFGKAGGVNPTVTLNATMTLTSTVALTSNCMTLAATTLTATMTMNGATIPAGLGSGSTATWNFADTVRVAGTIIADRGNWNFNAHTVNCNAFDLGNNSSLVRSIDLTNCTVNVAGTASQTWRYTSSETNITLTTTGSTINMTGNGTSFQTATGVSYNTVNFTGTGTITIQTGGATFVNLSAVNASILVLPISTTTTVTGTFTAPTTQIKSSASGTTTTLSLTNNVTLTNFTVTDVIHSGAGTGTLLNPVSVTTSSTGWVKQYTPSTADSALASDASTRAVVTASTAADSALAADVATRAGAFARSTAGDSAVTTDHPTTGSLFIATCSDSAAATDGATGRGTLHGQTADAAVSADQAHPSGQPVKASDSAVTTDFVFQNPVNQHPLAIDSGLAGHAMLGWLVLGGNDEGMPRLDVLVDPSSATPVSSLSWAHTVTDSPNGLLVVEVGLANASGQHVTSITYGGIPLTLGIAEGTSPVRSEIWYLSVPPAGTANVVVTLSAAAPMSTASLSFFNVRLGAPIRSTAIGNDFGAVISALLSPTEQSDYVLDVLTIGTTDVVTPTPPQLQLWAEQLETTSGPMTVASSHEYELESDGSEPIGWTSGAPTNWAYVAVALEPRLFQNVYAEDAANAVDQARPSAQPAHASDTAAAVDTADLTRQTPHASDSAAAVDTVHVSAPPAYTRDVAVSIDSTNKQYLTASASDTALLHDTVFRSQGFHAAAADQALSADVATRLVHDFRLPGDTAYSWDYTSDLAPMSALVTTSGVLGHAILGWWVLGNKDTYVRGRDAVDLALAVDVARAASGLKPHTNDQALAADSVARGANRFRTTADAALAADQASPFRNQFGTAVDSALTTDALTRHAVFGRRTSDAAVAADSASRLPPQPGHAFDGAFTNDAAVARYNKTAQAADAAVSTDAALAVQTAGLFDQAVSVDSVRRSAHPRVVLADQALTTDAARAARLVLAADQALSADAVSSRALPARAADQALAADSVATSLPMHGRATADQALALDSVTKSGIARSVSDFSLTADTAAAGRPSVRTTTDIAVTTDAAAWARTLPRTTTDFALVLDTAKGGLLELVSDQALSFDSASVRAGLVRLQTESATSVDRATFVLRAVAREVVFGKLVARWRIGPIVTTSHVPATYDFSGRL